MIDKEKLLKEFEKEFEKTKKELKFNPSLDELDSEFNFRNDILLKGFVPELFPRYLIHVIADYFRSWHGYLNGLLIPNSNFFANQTESKLFNSEEDKALIWDLICRAMEFSSESSYVNLDRSPEKIKDFMNNSYGYCISEFRPKLREIMLRVSEAWTKKN